MFKLVESGCGCTLSARLSRPATSHALTFLDNIDNVIGIEAEFIRVLSVIGIQSLALWHLGLRLGLRLGSAPCWGRPAGRLSPDTAERAEAGERRDRGPRHRVLVWTLASTGLLTCRSSSVLRRYVAP